MFAIWLTDPKKLTLHRNYTVINKSCRKVFINIRADIINSHSEVCSGNCVHIKRKLSIVSDSEICAKREIIEQQHYADYKVNEVMYRTWPEVQENPKYDCQRFLLPIYRFSEKIHVVTADIRKVILNYNQIRDVDGNTLTPKRVTALECRFTKPVWQRTFIYYIRSTQSPECALFLNRVGCRSINFYIVEDVCEHKEYTGFKNYTKALLGSIPAERSNITKRQKRKILLLTDEETRIKQVELEKKHYEYCSVNINVCKLWPEIQIIPENVCQRFLNKMLSARQEISLITETHLEVTLHYLELRGENHTSLDPVIVNAIACRLPQPIQSRNHVYFMRAPSYPSCVFYIIRKILQTSHFYIREEICDTPNYKTSLHTIIFEQGSHLAKKIQAYAHEKPEKLHMYEELHSQDYIIKPIAYLEWPELGEVNITLYCQTLMEIIFSQIEETYPNGRYEAVAKSIKLKYATAISITNINILPIRVKALECLIPERPPPNRFWFIRTPKPNKSVYWVRLRHKQNKFYFIVKEIYKDLAGGFFHQKKNGDEH